RRLDLELAFPEYAGRKPAREENAAGHVKALAGTRVSLRVSASAPLASASLAFEDGTEAPLSVSEASASGSFVVERRTSYEIRLRSPDGVASAGGMRYAVDALPDLPPKVEITAPGRDLAVAPGQAVQVHFKASDDVGLRAAVLLARPEAGDAAEAPVRGWRFADGVREASEGHPWDLAAAGAKPGDAILYRVVVHDVHPSGREASTPVYRIRVESAEKKQADLQAEIADLVAALRNLLRAQRLALERTEKIREAAASKVKLNESRTRGEIRKVAEAQARIRAESGAVAAKVKGGSAFESRVREVLSGLVANEFPAAEGALQAAAEEKDPRRWPASLAAATKAEGAAAEALKKLLEQTVDVLGKVKDLPPEQALQAPDEALDRRALLARAQETLKEFLKEQREVLEATEALAKKPVEDFTAADDAKAENLARIEDKLAKLLKDLKDDLSRLPEQDLSDGTMVEELIEIYTEVELAKDALTRKTVEMAVPFEQSGVELAESLTKNLEKWLSDVRDNLKWNMEDPTEDVEVPLADLPEELEDMVGDLIEEANDLEEDVEDVSSKWADSLDKGAGWGTADGPISNMSAQGKTGNMLPNDSEIGGRSGEGRTGRSSGQMVEKTAQGKGGRQTPFRLTPDPYEKGQVEDKSGDPGGGGTGGGKLSGSGAEGLRGPPPPALQKELDRLQGRTVEIRQKAEKLDANLRALRYPAEQVGDAILLLDRIGEHLKKGQVGRFAAEHKVLLEQLGDARTMIEGALRLNREALSRVPKRLRDELNSAAKEQMPEAYRELLRRYYRTLAEGK
ncbi:MAG: hypothetical protein MUC63_08285, partial [Planctomycetes bacterium]|nr:hypothetical protein [Planctomycetota bacterium]